MTPERSLAETARDETAAPKARLAEEVSQALASRTYLMVFQGDSTRMVAAPADSEITIGRQPTCELQLDDERVSRAHARITLKGGNATVTDLGSQNGTLLNDERIKGTWPLASGDSISIAGFVIVFHASPRPTQTGELLEPAAFRARAALEVERSTRFSRPLALLVVGFKGALPPLDAALRRLDLASQVAGGQLAVLCPECDGEEAQVRGERLLDAFEAAKLEARIGLAVFPADGADLETLLASARSAAADAAPGTFSLAAKTYRTLVFGGRQVLVADASMHRLYELVQRLATSELPVLIQGETGSGKELVATALHHGSPRRENRLLAVNCAALPETLLESELFGHEKGAFTGATSSKPALFELVDGGTIFLDEVNEMSPALQAKLLRALETRRVTRIGATKDREVSFRVVAATHRDLLEEVKAKRFREDLYFRLAGATVWLPPLRDRQREVQFLARRFLNEACTRAGRPAPALAPETQALFAQHPWPGNVRELNNVMEFVAATVTDTVVEPWHLAGRVGAAIEPAQETPAPDGTAAKVEFRPIGEEVSELERKRMVQALEATGWNQTRAAAAISMPLRTFVSRFKLYGLARHGSR